MGSWTRPQSKNDGMLIPLPSTSEDDLIDARKSQKPDAGDIIPIEGGPD